MSKLSTKVGIKNLIKLSYKMYLASYLDTSYETFSNMLLSYILYLHEIV